MPRNRKPTKLHVLEGTFRPDRHGDRAQEPQPEAGCAMPAFLAKLPRAAEIWKEESAELLRLGLLTKVDARSFGRLCLLWMWEEEAAGNLRPPLAIALLAELRQLEDKFGMNPAARAKLKTGEPEKPASKLDKYRKHG